MGEGIKIPESERPSFKVISDQLNAKISKQLQDLFVIDLQNDCACSTETYDSDLGRNAYYLSHSGIEKNLIDQITLPMLHSVTEQSIKELVAIATKHAGNDTFDQIYCGMIYNPVINFDRVLKTYRRYCGEPNYDTRGIYRWHANELVNNDYVYLIPDPEFFGVISANLGGFGAFCLASCIWKVPLEE